MLALPTLFLPIAGWCGLPALVPRPAPCATAPEIHFHHEAREVAARLYFLDRDKLGPGETALCEVRLDEPLVGVFGDHCVVRAFSPLRTVAGGVVLDPISAGLRRRDTRPIASPLCSAQKLRQNRVRMPIGGPESRREHRAAFRADQLDSKRLDKVLQALSGKGRVFCFDREEKGYVAADASAELAKRCLAWPKPSIKRNRSSRAWRAAHYPAAQAAKRGQGHPPRSWHFSSWSACCHVRASWFSEHVIRMASHTVSLKSDQAGLRDALLKAHVDGAFTPPNLKDVLEELKVDAKAAAPVLKLLCEDGSLVKVKDGLYFHGPVIQELKSRMQAWFGSHDDLDPAGFKGFPAAFPTPQSTSSRFSANISTASASPSGWATSGSRSGAQRGREGAGRREPFWRRASLSLPKPHPLSLPRLL